MLKIGGFKLFKQNHCISGIPQGIPCNFFLNGGESHVVVTRFTHIHSGLQQILFFQKFQYLENAPNA